MRRKRVAPPGAEVGRRLLHGGVDVGEGRRHVQVHDRVEPERLERDHAPVSGPPDDVDRTPAEDPIQQDVAAAWQVRPRTNPVPPGPLAA